MPVTYVPARADFRIANSQELSMVVVAFVVLFAVATLVAQRASRVIFASSTKFTSQQRAEGEQLFSEKVKPLLKRRCGKCHGEDTTHGPDYASTLGKRSSVADAAERQLLPASPARAC